MVLGSRHKVAVELAVSGAAILGLVRGIAACAQKHNHVVRIARQRWQRPVGKDAVNRSRGGIFAAEPGSRCGR